ncbi:MAG: hypothetical protein IJ012_06770 [Clostridia bacterium]|nr:hypothetical protein [Clostridia bacterium]
MKKTLLGVLAFVMILATVLTCSVFAADTTPTEGAKAADVQKVVGDAIEVDGYMDAAYATATPLEMATYATGAESIYTHGIARFLWSEEENALYCFIIVNDADVGAPKYDQDRESTFWWVADSIELFVDFTPDSKTQEGWGIPAGTPMSRSLQYRIDGNNGQATCFLSEDSKDFQLRDPDWKYTNAAGKDYGYYDCYATYVYDEDTGTFANDYDSMLFADGKNVFGWGASDDPTKQGWGWQRTEYGYTCEYRIEATSVTTPLYADQKVKFDIQANDMYQARRDSGSSSLNFYYNSSMRVATGQVGSSNSCTFYDWLVLSDTEVENDNTKTYTLAQLEDFGMADASTSKTKATTPREILKTDKKTWSRRPTSAVTNINDPDITTPPTNTTPGTQATTPAGDDTTGGCGSSITIGASVAAVALVGAAGFFVLRKKDEE